MLRAVSEHETGEPVEQGDMSRSQLVEGNPYAIDSQPTQRCSMSLESTIQCSEPHRVDKANTITGFAMGFEEFQVTAHEPEAAKVEAAVTESAQNSRYG